jgi:hypothetical protein
MVHNDIFSLQRFQYVFRRFLFLNYKGMLIAFSAISGVLIFIGVLTSIGSSDIDKESFIILSYIALFIGGFIITSTAFSEMHKPEKSVHFITLPASALEKMFSAYLSTTIIFLFIATAFFYASWYIASVLAFLLTKTPFEPINLINAGFWRVIGIYLAAQPVFFLGALYFKGHNFLKTLLALAVISFVNSIFQALMSLLIFGNLIFNNGFQGSNWIGSEDFFPNLFNIIKIVGLYIMPPFLLIVSYIRFNEREI